MDIIRVIECITCIPCQRQVRHPQYQVNHLCPLAYPLLLLPRLLLLLLLLLVTASLLFICDSPYPFGASNLTYTTVEYSEECWDSLLGAFPTNVDSTSMLIPCVIDGSASACLARYALFKGYHAITFTGLMLGEYATVKRKYVESAWSRSAGNFLTDDTHSGDLQPTTVHIL